MTVLSIIIPVYKVEKFVEATIQSIISQRQDVFEYEVIVVDDGTPDNSLNIVERYADRLPLIVIRQENMGLSSARNTGLKHAKGNYVWFVDSDDTLHPEAFENLHRVLGENDAEIYSFGLLTRHEGKDDLKPINTLYTKTPEKYINHIFTGNQLHRIIGTGIVQKNIFKRSFLDYYNLFFLMGIYHEDLEFLARAFFFAKKIFVTDIPLYVYLQRESGSIMTTKNERNLDSGIKILESFIQFRDQYAKTFFEKSIVNDRICGRAISLLSLNDSFIKGYSTYMKSRKGKIRIIGIKAGLSSLNIMTKGKLIRLCALIFIPRLLPRIRRGNFRGF